MHKRISMKAHWTLTALFAVAIAGAASHAAAQQNAAPLAAKASPEQMAAAKKTVTDLGGVVKEDAQGNVISIDMAAGRSWADDYQMQQVLVFPKLASLTVEGPGITNQLIPRLVEQKELTSLTLKNTLVDDQGIAELTAIPSLRIVDLRVAPLITDAAMDSLVKLPNLRAVRLVGGNITDHGVGVLMQAARLSELDVRNCRGVTKAGIDLVVKKASLRTLKLGGPAITDAMLAAVGEMTQLTGLYLDKCEITDAGLKQLARLPLQDFAVPQCPNITDSGLDVLSHFSNLRQLTLQGTAVRGAAL
jgi:hypothetical protein